MPSHDYRLLAETLLLTQSHTPKWFPKEYSFSTTWKSIPNCFSICGILKGLQLKEKTTGRNIAISDIKYIEKCDQIRKQMK